MGYECPVCGDPQADETHLANHLAFTAIARGGDHEAWLDEHVPEWGQLDDAGLADAVVDLAEEADFPQVFEDTTAERVQGGHDHGSGGHTHNHGGHSHGQGPAERADLPTGADTFGDPEIGPDERDILSEAIEMTEQRRQDTDGEDTDEDTGENCNS